MISVVFFAPVEVVIGGDHRHGVQDFIFIPVFGKFTFAGLVCSEFMAAAGFVTIENMHAPFGGDGGALDCGGFADLVKIAVVIG